ncbi:hypothetical protein, partial [Hoeflea sp.]|uniref:hypothetical protein n=1 Tax=Hoeflea sp. TaxID=1940281 RepID=UPI003A954B56
NQAGSTGCMAFSDVIGAPLSTAGDPERSQSTRQTAEKASKSGLNGSKITVGFWCRLPRREAGTPHCHGRSRNA